MQSNDVHKITKKERAYGMSGCVKMVPLVRPMVTKLQEVQTT